MIRVTAFNGSARRDGNTALLLRKAMSVLEEEGIQTELVQLAGQKVHGCLACGRCREAKSRQCEGLKDFVNECIAKMDASDGILIGSPTYFAGASSETKALIDRAGYTALANGGMFARKVGAAVVAVRRGGAIHVFDTINHLFLINQMIVPGSSYWNMGIGREKGEVEGDAEGMRTMEVLGSNMAWLLKKIKG